MKKILLFLSFLLMSIGVWGDSYTITFSGTNSESTSITTSTTAASITGSSSYVTGNVAAATKAYGATSSGIKLGTSSAAGSIKINLSASGQVTPTSIAVNCKLYNSNKSATLGVNGSTKQTVSSSYGDLTFNITSAIMYIQLDATKYVWVKSITVNYSNTPTPSTYTVTYNANTGTGTMTDSNSPYSSGATVTILDNSFTAPTGKQFDHWNTASNNSGTSYDEGDTFTISDNVTLYAQWANIPPSPIVSGKVFELLTDIDDLNDRDNIIILNNRKDRALSTTQNPNNRGVSQDYRLIMGKTVAILNDPSSVQIFRAEKDGDLWKFYDGDGYIYSAGSGSGKNYLRTSSSVDDNSKWSIDVDENNYATVISQGNETNNTLLYNSSGLFSSYAKLTTATRKIYIYKESTFSETYTITLKNQLGPDSVKAQSTIGEIVHIPMSMNICNNCYGSDWSLDGWVSSLEAYKPVYKDEFIPTKDIVLYALYSRGSIHPVEVDEYKLVTSSQENWSGDYLIAYDSHIFANGQVGGGTGDGMGAQDIYFDPDENLSNNVITVDCGDLYNITLEEVSDGSGTYLMKTKDGKYNYQTSNSNGLASTGNRSTAENYPLTITFNSSSDIDISIPAGAIFHYNTDGYFRFYKDGGQNNIYLYKKQTTTKPVATEYSTAPECDSSFITTWNKDKIFIDKGLSYDLTGKTVTIKDIDTDETLSNSINYDSNTDAYQVNVDLSGKECDKLNIFISDNTDSTYLIYKVPFIVDADAYTTSMDDENCDVVVLPGKKLTVLGTESEHRDVKLYGGAHLSIPSGTEYTVNSLSLRRDNLTPATLGLTGTLNTDKLYFDLYVDASDWYWVCLPDAFDLSNLKYANGRESIYLSDYWVSYYDGKHRAYTKEGSWADAANDTIFQPGAGFLFGLNDDLKKKEFRFEIPASRLATENSAKTSGEIHAWGYNLEVGPNHKGWNLIGNPYLNFYDADLTDPIRYGQLVKDPELPWNGKWIVREDERVGKKLRYAVIPTKAEQFADAGYYESVPLDDYPLAPFTCFFIQAGGTDEDSHPAVFNPESKRHNIVRRTPAQNQEEEELFLRIRVGEWKTGMFISNKFTDEYEPGDDLESHYQIYQSIGGYKLLYSAINDSIIEHGVQVTTPQGTLYLDPKVDVNKFEYIYANYNNDWYDLKSETVEVNGNFIIQAKRKTSDISTNLNDLIHTTDQSKILYKNNLYIKKDKHIYNILGGKVQ